MASSTINQLYVDVKHLAETQPSAQVGEQLAAIFNANLAEAKKAVPASPILQVIKDAKDSTEYRDLHVSLGQIRQVIEDAKPPRSAGASFKPS